jgi:hypothetical protein
MVLSEAPEAKEIWFKSYALSMTYSLTDRWTDGFCHVVVYRRHVNLGFNRGCDLHDPKGVLVGSGKVIRHIRIQTADDARQPHLRAFVKAAIKLSKDAISLRPPVKRSGRGGVKSRKRR